MSKEAKQTVEEAAKGYAKKQYGSYEHTGLEGRVKISTAIKSFKAGAEWAAPLPNERTAKQHKEGKTELSEFLEYVTETRDLFCMAINGREWDSKLKTECESLLICFDQMKERLATTPPTGNERTAQDCTDGKAEHEGGELDKKNPNYIHNLFMRNADVWTDEHGWMMRIDRFKEVARQLNNLLNF